MHFVTRQIWQNVLTPSLNAAFDMRPVNTWYMKLLLVNLVYSLTVNLKKKRIHSKSSENTWISKIVIYYQVSCSELTYVHYTFIWEVRSVYSILTNVWVIHCIMIFKCLWCLTVIQLFQFNIILEDSHCSLVSEASLCDIWLHICCLMPST